MASEKIDIRHVAKLARLALSDAEVDTYGAQLRDLLGHVDKLQELPIEGIAATAQVVPLRNVTRDDAVAATLDRDVVLSAAPQAHGQFFRVPKIIGEA